MRLKIVLLNLAFFVACIALFGAGFETDDDSMMMLLFDGSVLGYNFDFSANMSLYYGKYMCFLYYHLPGINWYLLHLLFFQYVATVTVWCVVLERFPKWNWFWILCGYNVLLVASLICKIQYTSTAACLGFAGVIMWINNMIQPTRIWSVLFALSMVLLSGLIRWQVFLLVIALSGPVILVLAVQRKVAIMNLIGPVLITIIFFMIRHVEKQEITDRFGLPNYLEYHASAEVVNNPVVLDSNRLDAIGLTPEDVKTMISWYWLDPDVYAKDKIVKMADIVQSHRSVSETMFYAGQKLYAERYTLLIYFLFMALAVFLSGWRPGPVFWFGLAVSAVFFLYLARGSRVHHRVTVSFEYFLFLLLIIDVLTKTNNTARVNASAIRWVTVLCGLAGLFLQVRWLTGLGRINARERVVAESSAAELSRLDGLVIVADGFPHNGFNSLIGHPPFSHGNVISNGMSCNSPWNELILRRFSVVNPTKAMVNNRRIVTVGYDHNLVSQYYLRHYKDTISFIGIPGEWKFIRPEHVVVNDKRSTP